MGIYVWVLAAPCTTIPLVSFSRCWNLVYCIFTSENYSGQGTNPCLHSPIYKTSSLKLYLTTRIYILYSVTSPVAWGV